MNKIIIISFVSLVLISGGLVLFSNSDSNNVSSNANNSSGNKTSTINEIQQKQSSSTQNLLANYVDYSDSELMKAEGTKRIVFFHANWCSTCNFFDGQIKEQGVPEGITILKADFDKDNVTKKKYGVVIQSTFVLLDDSGEVVKTWPFAQGLRSINDLYNAVLEGV